MHAICPKLLILLSVSMLIMFVDQFQLWDSSKLCSSGNPSDLYFWSAEFESQLEYGISSQKLLAFSLFLQTNFRTGPLNKSWPFPFKSFPIHCSFRIAQENHIFKLQTHIYILYIRIIPKLNSPLLNVFNPSATLFALYPNIRYRIPFQSKLIL
jgi:hypothetical protein